MEFFVRYRRTYILKNNLNILWYEIVNWFTMNELVFIVRNINLLLVNEKEFSFDISDKL